MQKTERYTNLFDRSAFLGARFGNAQSPLTLTTCFNVATISTKSF